MNFLPTDWVSFLWGVLAGAVVLFFTGFLKKLGEEAAVKLKERIFPKPPEPIRVKNSFVPELFEPGKCAWIPETKIYEKEAEGFTFYPHPNKGAKCYRTAGHGAINEYLMVSPSAKPKQGI